MWLSTLHTQGSLETFAFARRLTYQRSAADPVHTLSAAFVGSSMAQVALTMVLARPVQSLIDAHPQRPIKLEYARTRCIPQDITREIDVSVRFIVYVDDIAMHVYRTLIEKLVGDLQMRVSRRNQWSTEEDGKTQVVSWQKQVRNAGSTAMGRLGIRIHTKASHLGVPFRPGGTTCAPSPHRLHQMGGTRETTSPSSPHGV